MELWKIILFVVYIIGLVECKKASKKVETSEEKAAKRLEALGNFFEAIPLSDRNFSSFVIDRPRRYSSLVLFTATAPKYQCFICQSVKVVFQDIATLYHEQYNFVEIDQSKKLAFFVLEVDDSRQSFGELGIESVPRLYLLPPAEKSDPKRDLGNFELEARYLIEGISSTIQIIEEKSDIKISITIDPFPVIAGACVIAVIFAWLMTAASKDYGAALFWYQNRSLVLIVSLICFSVGVSGSIYCIIRDAPLIGQGRRGTQIFAGAGGRDQYLLEGIIIALLTIGAGLAMMMIHYSTKSSWWLVRHVGVIFSLSVLVVCLLEIFNHYCDKTRWYKLQDTLPPEVWTWINSKVKKNSGLAKRLLRLGEYYIYEFKNWEGLQQKAQQLVGDYALREYGALVEQYWKK